MENILVTWTSWFIWFSLAKRLLDDWNNIIWIDNENDYYDISLKEARRRILEKYDNFKFYKWDLGNIHRMDEIFKDNKIDKVVNLAAQAWVRYSIINPFSYIQSNLVWFHNILFLSKEYKVKNFVYASSSSVYWNNKKQPSSIDDKVDNPISLYAATKKSNELIAHSYSHLFWLPTIWLRFFTVYWPWSRPDMAMLKFAHKISKWETIDVYNYGKMKRDFTYIDDIVDWIILALNYETKYDIFNLWSDSPIELEYLITLLEENLWKKANKNYMPLQDWDVLETSADIEYTKEKLWWEPKFRIEEWVKNFADWFKDFYNYYI